MKKIFVVLIILTVFFAMNLSQDKVAKDTKTVIRFASWGSKSEIDIIKPILKEFETQYPQYRIEFIHIPENYFQKIHLLFASNSPLDVVFMNNLYLPFFANAGTLEELKGNFTKYFEPKSLEALSFNGKLYGVPRDISILVVYINKDLFKKYNVKLPNKHWDFSDLLTISKKLTQDVDDDGKTDIWGISFEETLPLYYLPYLMSEGGGILSDDLMQDIFETQESQNGLNYYNDLRNKYHVAPTKSESASATMAQMFLNEKIAMQVSGRWLVPKYLKDADFDWNIINFPAGSKGSIVPLDASGWCISKKSKNKEGAKKLISFLANNENIINFVNSGLIVPARLDVLNNEFLRQNYCNSKCFSKINDKVFINAIKTAKTTPVSVDYNQIQDAVTQRTSYLFNK